MSTVPVHEALFWRGDSPMDMCGEVDFESLAYGLALTEHRIEARGRFDPHQRPASDDRSAPRQQPAPRQRPAPGNRIAARKRYTRAQHALIVSEAVDTLAGLEVTARRVLATHACLAAVREERLNPEDGTRGRTKYTWRTMDIEALAEALAHTSRWGRGEGPAPCAVAVDGLLEGLAGLSDEDLATLALHALLSETVPAGLGTAVAEAALGGAGLGLRVPAAWAGILRLIRRMADAAVRRDVPGAGPGGLSSFPALERRIVPLDPATAGRLWLERYRTLSPAGGGPSAGGIPPAGVIAVQDNTGDRETGDRK